MKEKEVYYKIYSEFNKVNKYRELKSMVHHGTNRLDHINRVSKLSFRLSKAFKLDYISCTRGALLHDFFTVEDIKRGKGFLKEHPKIALKNSKDHFELNEIEENIILSHMFPIGKEKPKYAEARVVCFCDKLVSIYEFFRYQIIAAVNLVFLLFTR